MTVPHAALQEIAPGAIIELFELELFEAIHGYNDTLRFHAGTNFNNDNNLTWNNNVYLRFPVEAEGFEYTGNGQLPRPSISISNIFSTISAILLSLPDGLEGAKVTRIRTLGRYIDGANFPPTDVMLLEDGFALLYEDSTEIYLEPINATADPTAEFPREIYYVDRKVAETRDVVKFELASAFDLAGVSAPKRKCIANICQWIYKSTECGYTGGLPSCLKTLDDCTNHFGVNQPLPFGSFPGIGSYFV
jgi:phage-related protein